MKLLLDTHAFLWWVFQDPKLSKAAAEAMGDPGNSLVLSVASAWEISIKWGLGRLKLNDEPAVFVPQELVRNRIGLVPIDVEHALVVGKLPHHHGDPFDRMLVVQALAEDMPVVTRDPAFPLYGVRVIW